MIYREPRQDEQKIYNEAANHPLQTWEWGDFRKDTGVMFERVARFEGKKLAKTFQITFHKVPHLSNTVGYFPKGEKMDEVDLATLRELGKRHKAIFIKMEPDISTPPKKSEDIHEYRDFLLKNGCKVGRSQFTPHSFILDLTKSEEDLLKHMKSKTRYNIRIAQKNGVEITEDSTEQGLEDYLRLLKETTSRQKFYAHTEQYQRKMWKHMSVKGKARIMKATYQGQVLTAWVIFVHNDTLYYPYGASSRDHKKVMASNLLMWEVIRFGKEMGLKKFDMWGSLGPDPDINDPWFGFHRFKAGYGGDLAEFVGTYDLVLDETKYKLFKFMDKWRWRYLRFRKTFGL